MELLRRHHPDRAVGVEGCFSHLTIATTILGSGPGRTTNAPVSGKVLLRPTTAGTYTLRLGQLGDLVLNGFDASGQPKDSVELPTPGSFGPCTSDTGPPR